MSASAGAIIRVLIETESKLAMQIASTSFGGESVSKPKDDIFALDLTDDENGC